MNRTQAKILLEKINALHKSMDLDQGNITPIERDLMLSYLRQLYELFIQAGEAATAPAVEDDGSTHKREASTTPERPRPEPIRRNPYKPPRIIEIPDPADPEKKPATQSVRSTPKPKPEPEPTKRRPPAPEPEPQKEKAPPVVADHSELNLLFEQRKATELSEKLGESPLPDLTKAMSINDRLLYTNQLFGKDRQHLDHTLQQLNRFSDMTQAKPLLLELARRHDWVDEEKQDVAKSFIKMVRRRYI